jgi:hypothetical protein
VYKYAIWRTGTTKACHCYFSCKPEFETFQESKNRFQGIDSVSLCSPAGQYVNRGLSVARLEINSWAPSEVYEFGLSTCERIQQIGWRNQFPGSLKNLQIQAQHLWADTTNRLAESIPGLLKVYKFGFWQTKGKYLVWKIER